MTEKNDKDITSILILLLTTGVAMEIEDVNVAVSFSNRPTTPSRVSRKSGEKCEQGGGVF